MLSIKSKQADETASAEDEATKQKELRNKYIFDKFYTDMHDAFINCFDTEQEFMAFLNMFKIYIKTGGDYIIVYEAFNLRENENLQPSQPGGNKKMYSKKIGGMSCEEANNLVITYANKKDNINTYISGDILSIIAILLSNMGYYSPYCFTTKPQFKPKCNMICGTKLSHLDRKIMGEFEDKIAHLTDDDQKNEKRTTKIEEQLLNLLRDGTKIMCVSLESIFMKETLNNRLNGIIFSPKGYYYRYRMAGTIVYVTISENKDHTDAILLCVMDFNHPINPVEPAKNHYDAAIMEKIYTGIEKAFHNFLAIDIYYNNENQKKEKKNLTDKQQLFVDKIQGKMLKFPWKHRPDVGILGPAALAQMLQPEKKDKGERARRSETARAAKEADAKQIVDDKVALLLQVGLFTSEDIDNMKKITKDEEGGGKGEEKEMFVNLGDICETSCTTENACAITDIIKTFGTDIPGIHIYLKDLYEFFDTKLKDGDSVSDDKLAKIKEMLKKSLLKLFHKILPQIFDIFFIITKIIKKKEGQKSNRSSSPV